MHAYIHICIYIYIYTYIHMYTSIDICIYDKKNFEQVAGRVSDITLAVTPAMEIRAGEKITLILPGFSGPDSSSLRVAATFQVCPLKVPSNFRLSSLNSVYFQVCPL